MKEMTRKQRAKALAQHNMYYRARKLDDGQWVVWSDTLDRVVEFDEIYWVEAQYAVKDKVEAQHKVYDSERVKRAVVAYEVWHLNTEGARERVKRYVITRRGGWRVALLLANKARDQLSPIFRSPV